MNDASAGSSAHGRLRAFIHHESTAGRIRMGGVGCLAGIGFTMSLFTGSLGLASVELQSSVRVGVIAGSAISTGIGEAVLFRAARTKPA